MPPPKIYITPCSILVFLILPGCSAEGRGCMGGCAVCLQGLRVGAKWGLPPDQSLTLSPSSKPYSAPPSHHHLLFHMLVTNEKSCCVGHAVRSHVYPQGVPCLQASLLLVQGGAAYLSPFLLLNSHPSHPSVATLFLTCAHFLFNP